MFIKQVVINRGFPYLPSADPFFSASNISHLIKVKTDAEADRNMEIHDLIED